MVASLILSLVAAPALTLLPQDAEPVWIAELGSGIRVECDGKARQGAREFSTPFGRYDAAMDPVAKVTDARRELAMLDAVRQSDPAAWVARLDERGFVGALIAAADKQMAEPEPRIDTADLLGLLERWGARFDVVPRKVKYDKRIDYLWARLQKTKQASLAAMIGGRLSAEIPGAGASFDRRLSLVDLRKGLKHRQPVVRRTAARVAHKQREDDIRPQLLASSLEDPRGEVRIASASSLHGLGEPHALGGWTLAMWRADGEDQRNRAVGYLGQFGNAATVEYLMTSLAAAQAQSEGNYGNSAFTYFGRQIALVRDFDVEVAQAAIIADPVVDVVQEGSVLHVRVMAVNTVRHVMAALQNLTGARPGPTVQSWLDWHKQQKAATASN